MLLEIVLLICDSTFVKHCEHYCSPWNIIFLSFNYTEKIFKYYIFKICLTPRIQNFIAFHETSFSWVFFKRKSWDINDNLVEKKKLKHQHREAWFQWICPVDLGTKDNTIVAHNSGLASSKEEAKAVLANPGFYFWKYGIWSYFVIFQGSKIIQIKIKTS